MSSPRGRVTAAVNTDFVVLLIGMRVNGIRHLRRSWRLFSAMSGMIRELSGDRTTGYLGGESWFGNPTIMVQYWRSFDHLESYARSQERAHRPAWAAFNDALRQGGQVGVWHEAYRVRPGDFETVYNNMPPFGLARATKAVPATGRRETAAGRFGLRTDGRRVAPAQVAAQGQPARPDGSA